MSLFEEVAQKFGQKIRRDRKGLYIKIPGPGHSGKDDSLKVRPSKEGDDITVHSFSGDDWAEAKDWLREQMGKQAFLREGKKKNGNGNGKSGGAKTLVAEYVYANELNQPYLKVKKFLDDHNKKHFYQEHWDGKGWVTGKPAGSKVPYKLPELIKSHPSNPVFLCEGEKDADSLIKLSLTATSASEGANAAWDSALTPYFKDRAVVILPHADAPGRNHAVKVARNLFQVAKSIQILDLYPDRDDTGDDVSVFLEHDKDGVALMKRVKETPEWTPDVEKQKEDDLITGLSMLSGIDQLKERKALAKRLGLHERDLQKLLQDKEATGTQPAHWAVEPWAEPVLTEALLDRLEEFYTAHVILPPHASVAMALWCLHTWVHDAASATAFLHFTSPVPECGKSRAMEALLWTVQRGEMASNISPSAIFRYIDRCHPTLIFDEAETYTKREDVRGILDGSHTRAGAYTIRNVGDNHEATRFSTWGPKVIGGLDKLAATIRSRCITIQMKRKKKAEKVIKLRGRDTDTFKAMRSQACRWANDNIETLKTAQPLLPDGLTDRGEDCWEPLFAIAELAGPGWIAKAYAAALAFNGNHDVEDDSPGVQLLAAIKDLFDNMQETSDEKRVTSEAIVEHLLKDETGPWLAYGKMQKEISKRQVADLLRPYNIRPGSKRIDGDPNKRGYEFASFKDAFDAYLAIPPISSATPPQVSDNKHLAQFSSATPGKPVADEKADKSLISQTCGGVADQKQGDPPIRMVCGYCDGPADGTEVTARSPASACSCTRNASTAGWTRQRP
jgi:hypothetical protein